MAANNLIISPEMADDNNKMFRVSEAICEYVNFTESGY
jgi:hypothetical protein